MFSVLHQALTDKAVFITSRVKSRFDDSGTGSDTDSDRSLQLPRNDSGVSFKSKESLSHSTHRKHSRRSSNYEAACKGIWGEMGGHAAHVQDCPKEETTAGNRSTGFPEPLSPDRNTTLTHPDADTSPGCSLEGPDPATMRRHHSRGSLFHHRHHNKGISPYMQNGNLDPSTSTMSMSSGDGLGSMYDNIQYADGSHLEKSHDKRDSGISVNDGRRNSSKSLVAGNFSKQASNVEGKGGDARNDDEVSVIDEVEDEPEHKDGDRMKGFLRKLHLHKG